MSKLKVLNDIEVINFSCAGRECEYVLAEASEKNIEMLLRSGFTQSEIDEAKGDDGEDSDVIDLSILAFHHADANWWSRVDGFTKYSKYD